MDFSILQQFSDAGFNLVGCLPVSSLSDEERLKLTEAIPKFTSGSLLLIASGGQLLWQKSAVWRKANITEPDPFNRYSLITAETILAQHELGYTCLYPSTEYSVGLVNCGKQLGWHGESTLGLGMNPEFGLWSAYRLLLWVDQDIAVTQKVEPIDYCKDCIDKPCLSACPVNALDKQGMEKWQTCSQHRLSTDSTCADRCFSRLVCPVATEHRYTEEQMQYHYTASLKTIREWYENKE